jgi:hypothetical protein
MEKYVVINGLVYLFDFLFKYFKPVKFFYRFILGAVTK